MSAALLDSVNPSIVMTNAHSRATPPPWEARFCTDLRWADVVADGRVLDEWAATSLPQTLPMAGVPGLATGLIRVNGPEGLVQVSAHPLLRGDRGAVIVRLVMPDGWTGAFVRSVTTILDEETSHEHDKRTWTDFVTRTFDGFTRSFDPARHTDVPAEVLDTSVLRAATQLRVALEDPLGWFGGIPPKETAPTNPAHELADYAAYGFPSLATAYGVFDAWEHGFLNLLTAQDCGFELGERLSREWLIRAGKDRWAHFHEDGFKGLAALRRAGWTLPAMTRLHAEAQEATKAVSESPVDQHWELVNDWGKWSRIDEWSAVHSDLEVVSCCLEAGLTLDEATAMRRRGTLDVSTIKMLAALNSHASA